MFLQIISKNTKYFLSWFDIKFGILPAYYIYTVSGLIKPTFLNIIIKIKDTKIIQEIFKFYSGEIKYLLREDI